MSRRLKFKLISKVIKRVTRFDRHYTAFTVVSTRLNSRTANPLLRTFTRISRFSPGRSHPADSRLRNARAVHACDCMRARARRWPARVPAASGNVIHLRVHARVRTLTLLLRQWIHGESINTRAPTLHRISNVKTVILKFNGWLIKHMYNFHNIICINAR